MQKLKRYSVRRVNPDRGNANRKCVPYYEFYREHGGQRGYRGHVLNLTQDIQSFFNSLPSRASDLPVLVLRRHGDENTH